MGQSPAAEQLVLEHQGLVKQLALKIKAQLELTTVELDDLISFGNQGLVEAARRYDAARGAQFKTFAYYRVRGAIIDGVRAMAYLPRRVHAKLKAAEAQDDVTEPVGEARTSSAEARADAGATVEAMADTLGRLTASFVMASVGQGDDDAPRTPEEQVASAQVTERVSKALAALPERERALVQGFYFDGRTFDEVAKQLGISKSWASRLHTKALDLLRLSLRE